MAVDIKAMFNEELPAALAKNAEEVKTIGGTFQINLIGEGEWNIDVASAVPTCKPGTGAADCTITMSGADFQKLLENPQVNGPLLLFSRKVKIVGSQLQAIKLEKLFSYR